MNWLPLTIVFSVYFIDQLTKYLVVQNMVLDERISILGDFLRLKYIENTGIAFGLFSTWDKLWKDLIFSSLTIVAIGFVIYYYRIVQKRTIRCAFALILGGALGNLSDKLFGFIIFEGKFELFYSRVVDFIDIDIGITRWPTFNVADIAITIGVILLIINVFKSNEMEIFAPSQTKKR